jgi:hypothetical protein
MKSEKILLMLLTLLSSLSFYAQEKLDKIIKKNYDIIECRISKMSDQAVEYSLPNETLVISLDVSQIAKIDFASGRSQVFNTQQTSQTAAASSEPSSAVVIKPNTIAVLPVPFVNSENLSNSEEMAKFAQNDIYNKLLDKSSNIFPLTAQDLRVTNSLLRKAGIDYKNIDETPIDELHKILGADHIIAAKVSYTETQNQTSSTYNTGNAKVNNNKIKGSSVSTSNTNTELVYNYHVYFDLYKSNAKIYTKSREPIFKTKDSWMDSVSYLLKRSPIYVK